MDGSSREDLDVLKRALIGADRDLALAATQRLVDDDVDPTTILEDGMAVAMFDLGEMWKRGEVFLPEVVASAEVFKQCNAIVEPVLLARKSDDDEANTTRPTPARRAPSSSFAVAVTLASM